MRKSVLYVPDEPKPQCKSSNVMPSQDIQLHGTRHAGTVTYQCGRDEGHDGNCHCACGASWLKNYK